MAAVTAALSLLPHGGTVVAPDAAYNGVVATLDAREAEGSATVRRVDVADTGAVLAALDGADLLWLESPTNPLLEVADLPALLAAARERGVLVGRGQHLRHAAAAAAARARRRRRRALGDQVPLRPQRRAARRRGHTPHGCRRAHHQRLLTHRTLHGAIAGPMEVWLALRGLRTLHLRVERAQASALELAARLRGHPAVRAGALPGRGAASSPSRSRAGSRRAERVCAATRVWVHSTSLGGVESQLERRRRIPSEPVKVPENLIRLSVGIEDVDDLWRDLSQALDHA